MIGTLNPLWIKFFKITTHTHTHTDIKDYTQSCTHNRVHPQKEQRRYWNSSEIIKARLANTVANLTPVALWQKVAVVPKYTITAVAAVFFS